MPGHEDKEAQTENPGTITFPQDTPGKCRTPMACMERLATWVVTPGVPLYISGEVPVFPGEPTLFWKVVHLENTARQICSGTPGV